jgi:very-short-patch-repair endonuclease
MRKESATPDHSLARIAARNHGVITFQELLAAGLSTGGVARRVNAGRLHRVHRGVYAVGHPSLSPQGRWIAAVKACGDGAALSHRSAGELWGLLEPASGPVHVTVPGRAGRRRRPGIRVHRSRTLHPGTTRLRDRIPVTTPTRTILDLRRTERPETVRRAIREAEFRGLAIEDIHTDGTRSELERAFLQLCTRHRLPHPEVNARVGRFTADFLWRDRRLIVELDGFRAHGGRQAFEDDRARDVELRVLGYQVVRFTYRQVLDDPAGVAAKVRLLLGGALS